MKQSEAGTEQGTLKNRDMMENRGGGGVGICNRGGGMGGGGFKKFHFHWENKSKKT
jgi:hypothetical protein